MNTTFLLSFLIRASVHVSVVNQITFNFLLDFSVPVAYNQGTRPISCWFSVRPARLHPDGAFALFDVGSTRYLVFTLVSPVPILVGICSPSAIIRTVSLVVVNAVNRPILETSQNHKSIQGKL